MGWYKGVKESFAELLGTAVLLGQYAFGPLFRFVQKSRLLEMNTAVALLIVVGIAALMSMVGLSPALVTFLCGGMLAGSECRHELEAQIAPFKGLLLGLFFITVGAAIDMTLLVHEPLLILGLTVALMALVSSATRGSGDVAGAASCASAGA